MTPTHYNYPALRKKSASLDASERLTTVLGRLSFVLFVAWVAAMGTLAIYTSPASLIIAFSGLLPWMLVNFFYWQTLDRKLSLGGKITDNVGYPNSTYRLGLSSWAIAVIGGNCALAEYFLTPHIMTLGVSATVIPVIFYAVVLCSAAAQLYFMTATFSTLSNPPRLTIGDKLTPDTRLCAWLSLDPKLKNCASPFHFLYTSHTATLLLNKNYHLNQRGEKSPIPLELAIGFMDVAVFTECLNYYNTASLEYKQSIAATRKLVTQALRRTPYINRHHATLQALMKALVAAPQPSDHPPHTQSHPVRLSTYPSNNARAQPAPSRYPTQPTKTVAGNPTAKAPPPSLTAAHSPSFPQSIHADKPASKPQKKDSSQQSNKQLNIDPSRFPSLLSTLQHIPLPNVGQLLTHLSSSEADQCRQLDRAARLHSAVKKKAPFTHMQSVFATRDPGNYKTLKQTFHALTDTFRHIQDHTLPSSMLYYQSNLSALSVSAQCTIILARLFLRLSRYHNAFLNPHFAYTSLNKPGPSYWVRLHKSASNRKLLHLGITLPARALKLTYDLLSFFYLLHDLTWAHNASQNLPRLAYPFTTVAHALQAELFTGLEQLATGSTMPRFYLLHDRYTFFIQNSVKQRPLDIMQEHPRFQSIFSTHYHCTSPTLVERYAGPIPSDADIAAYLSKQNASLDSIVRNAFTLWGKLTNPKLPFWFHCTISENFLSILRSGAILVNHRCRSGAFISNRVNRGYGDYTFALSKETPLMSNTFNKTRSVHNEIWHGCKDAIHLPAHLVAIGYPDGQAKTIQQTLTPIGTVYLDPKNHHPVLFDYKGIVVFLFEQKQLDDIQIQMQKAIETLYPAQNGNSAVMPLPAHLMCHGPFNSHDAQDDACLPLSQQLADSRRALSHRTSGKPPRHI